MKMRRLPSHPAFKLEGSRFFRSFWELELTPGEETDAHQHADSEEVLYIVSGEAIITVAADERPVQPGEVVLVPPRTDHIIANRSGQLLQALQVESRLPAASAPGEVVEPIVPDEAARKTVQTIESLISGLPKDVDEAVAIRTIVELFDIGGGLTEQLGQLKVQGQQLCDPNVWDGGLALQFRGTWPQTAGTLDRITSELEELRIRVDRVNADIMLAGGN